MDSTDRRREQELGHVAGRVVKVAYDVISENLERGKQAAARMARGERPKLDEQTARENSQRTGKEVRKLGNETARFLEETILAVSRFGSGFMESVDDGRKAAQPRDPIDRAAALFLAGVAQAVAPVTWALKHRHEPAPAKERGTPGPLELKKKEPGEKELEEKAPTEKEPVEFRGLFKVQNVTGLNARFEFTSNGLLGPRGSRIPPEAVEFATKRCILPEAAEFATKPPGGDSAPRKLSDSGKWAMALSVYIPAGQTATLRIRVRSDETTPAGVYDGLVIGRSATLRNHLKPEDRQPRRDGAAREDRVSRAIQLKIERAGTPSDQRP